MAEIIDGVTIKMGGKEYTVPPLTFKSLRQLQPRIDSLGKIKGAPTEDQMSAVTDIVHAALSRNYPNTTKEEVEDMIDLGNLSTVLNAIMGVSGFEQGEAQAGSR